MPRPLGGPNSGPADVKERIDLFRDHVEKAHEQIKRCAKVTGKMGVLDLRGEDTIFATNRFTIYALLPEINLSIHVIGGLNKLNTVLAVGKSVLDRTSKTNIGALMLEYGGGGHPNAGTCQIDNDEADGVLDELVARIAANG